MNEELQGSENICKGVPFKEGFDERRNYDGRPPDTPEKKIMKKAIKEIVKEYKESLADSLPLIAPIIKAKALEGDMSAIKEIHDRVMDKAKQSTDITTDGKELPQPLLYVLNNNSNTEDSQTKQED